MDHNDHVNLLKPAKLPPGGSWADLGAGSGAFTLALRELVGPTADIHAVDKDRSSLRELEQAYKARFGDSSRLQLLPADFTRPLDRSTPSAAQRLVLLDGIVMASSLHFFKDKGKMLRHVRSFLKPGGVLLLVEYNVDSGNPWVPYPLSFESFRDLAPRAGFSAPRLLGTAPSRFLCGFYSAAAQKLEH